ncbi:LysE family transporter [Saccharibacter sp. 17.LH.SD]|uniref:LysE family translocator n=1 Tax=Saccharibacter sp. 17.LH.SD TaxID=2689393 RepID=UPI001368B81B|nr:LysE family translocator [Saccharibacter sp. 17.LH.SD]MXV43523.1 LysE family transporter [Saccharibacter sp. 17.LH.SD]
MIPSLITSLVFYSFITSVTPGPNNLMLLTSGANFGFIRSTPHILGISFGFFVMLLSVGFGVGALLSTFPTLHIVLKLMSGVYLLYLSWRIAMTRSIGKSKDISQRPMTFLGASAFQWINPKVWVMALTAIAMYTNTIHPFSSVVIVSIIFAAINLPSVALWASCGTMLRHFLDDPVRLKWFNITMGLLLALTLWPLMMSST